MKFLHWWVKICFGILAKINMVKYTNSLVNSDSFYANFTKVSSSYHLCVECFSQLSFDSKVSKKDDKVDLNESSTKYTKIYLNSNISSFQFRKVWCCLHWVKLRFYDLFAAESVSQQCWSKWATKLKFCWVFSNQQQNLRAKRTGNFSLGIFFWIRKQAQKIM